MIHAILLWNEQSRLEYKDEGREEKCNGISKAISPIINILGFDGHCKIHIFYVVRRCASTHVRSFLHDKSHNNKINIIYPLLNALNFHIDKKFHFKNSCQ